jgi:hypothetical protein
MIKRVLLHIFMVNLMFGQILASEGSSWVLLEFNDKVRAQPVRYTGTEFPTFSKWSAACKDRNMKNRNKAQAGFDSGFKSLGSKDLQWQEFHKILVNWFHMMVTGPLKDSVLWQNSNYNKLLKPDSGFYNLSKLPQFMPYAQKIIAEPGDAFFIRGDLHGDIFSLLAQLEKMQQDGVLDDTFRIIPDNAWVLFLGDYVDRGQYGCEVLYTMMRLALANPDRVIFVRGNHEDLRISEKYGFKEEVLKKFDDKDGLKHKTISRMNDLLPVVLYVGCQDTASNFTNYLQCCHGGLEIGYDPKPFLDNHETMYQLLGLLHQTSFVQKFIQDCNQQVSGVFRWLKSFAIKDQYLKMKEWWEQSWKNIHSHLADNRLLLEPSDGYSLALGFMWNDFEIANRHPVVYEPKRGLSYGKELTEKILELQSSDKSKIFGVFRAHQHGDRAMMEALKYNSGVYKLWSFTSDDVMNDRYWSHAENIVARDCADMTHCRTLIGGSVWTFNVGADSVYGNDFGFNFDAYGRLVVQQQLKDWNLQVFNTQIIE